MLKETAGLLDGLDENKLAEIKSAVQSGADVEMICDMLVAAGIETDREKVEAALAAAQAKLGQHYAETGELDDEQLEAVAGGGDGLCEGEADCDYTFKHCPKAPMDKRCWWKFYCDNFFDTFDKFDKYRCCVGDWYCDNPSLNR